jgi:hypothetical protein
VQEDVFGRQQKDWDARRDTFNAMFEDDEIFKVSPAAISRTYLLKSCNNNSAALLSLCLP